MVFILVFLTLALLFLGLILLLLKHGHVLAAIGFGSNLGTVQESDLDGTRQGADLGDRSVSVCGSDESIHGRCSLDLIFVGLMLVAQTAHESAADARDLGGIEGEVLLLRHFDGNLAEIGEEEIAAQGSAAHTHSTHELCLVSNTDLTQLNAGAEHRRQILYQLAEVYAARGGEVKEELGVVKGILSVDELHVQLVGGDLLGADAEGTLLQLLVCLMVLAVDLGCQTENGTKGRNGVALLYHRVSHGHLTEFLSSCGLHDHVGALFHGGILQRLEIIGLT